MEMKKAASFAWTPKRKIAQVRNWATYKLNGMITNLALIQTYEVEKMELDKETTAKIKLALYQAHHNLVIAKQLIRKEYDK